MPTFDDPLAHRAAALAALVENRLPLEGNSTGPWDAWPVAGPALLAHATSILNAIFLLRPHDAHNASSRLLRSLYDHVVNFAWLAIDPPAHLALWRKSDLEERLKMDRDFRDAGEQLLSAEAREQMERDVASVGGSAPNLADKALRADDCWVPRIEGIEPEGLKSFRGFYTVLFRQHSGLVHATMRGLNHVTIDLAAPRKRVVLEAPLNGSRGPYGMATVVYSLGLLVASQSLGWPDPAEVEAILARTL
jgi:hypothetical protein